MTNNPTLHTRGRRQDVGSGVFDVFRALAFTKFRCDVRSDKWNAKASYLYLADLDFGYLFNSRVHTDKGIALVNACALAKHYKKQLRDVTRIIKHLEKRHDEQTNS